MIFYKKINKIIFQIYIYIYKDNFYNLGVWKIKEETTGRGREECEVQRAKKRKKKKGSRGKAREKVHVIRKPCERS